LYVGDHIFGDIIKSKKQKAWRTMLVVPELNHELKVFHDKRDLFNTLEALDTSISELLRSFDITSNEGPDAVIKIKQKIQVRVLYDEKRSLKIKHRIFRIFEERLQISCYLASKYDEEFNLPF
jgi:hypothetical protein